MDGHGQVQAHDGARRRCVEDEQAPGTRPRHNEPGAHEEDAVQRQGRVGNHAACQRGARRHHGRRVLCDRARPQVHTLVAPRQSPVAAGEDCGPDWMRFETWPYHIGLAVDDDHGVVVRGVELRLRVRGDVVQGHGQCHPTALREWVDVQNILKGVRDGQSLVATLGTKVVVAVAGARTTGLLMPPERRLMATTAVAVSTAWPSCTSDLLGAGARPAAYRVKRLVGPRVGICFLDQAIPTYVLTVMAHAPSTKLWTLNPAGVTARMNALPTLQSHLVSVSNACWIAGMTYCATVADVWRLRTVTEPAMLTDTRWSGKRVSC